MRLLLLSVLAVVVTSASCTLRESHVRCHSSADCLVSQQCYRGYCVIGDAGDLTATQSEKAQLASPDAAAEPMSEATTCQATSVLDTSAEGACCDAAVSCYDGPTGTLDVGSCKAGMRSCLAGKLTGACSESVLPSAESCANQGSDDDCDGQLDNIAGRGEACMLMSAFGTRCGEGQRDCADGDEALSCIRIGAEPAETCNYQDDDCDGQIDEGFDISTDRANCGSCGVTCQSDQLCCAGSCLAKSAASASGCPSCSTERPCAESASCCGGACRDLTRDRRHCGACGHSCEQAERCCDGACSSSCPDE